VFRAINFFGQPQFDVVIVPHVDAENYATDVDHSMLYIACTRAMHRLTLTCCGEVSGLIAEREVIAES